METDDRLYVCTGQRSAAWSQGAGVWRSAIPSAVNCCSFRLDGGWRHRKDTERPTDRPDIAPPRRGASTPTGRATHLALSPHTSADHDGQGTIHTVYKHKSALKSEKKASLQSILLPAAAEHAQCQRRRPLSARRRGLSGRRSQRQGVEARTAPLLSRNRNGGEPSLHGSGQL
ncbi:hypothetical protein C0Q70_21201 [Pomacea canaliculata]|uniref:Uncharacterized protein n=1 Tax=Pomacea canaliculata TaxID=400727 RepID=A0A2T7NBW2_POMCA|nr:hypothetical protein C0Q70_21201 [Pomacea canaliculata]